jgi:hypothetical protein
MLVDKIVVTIDNYLDCNLWKNLSGIYLFAIIANTPEMQSAKVLTPPSLA